MKQTIMNLVVNYVLKGHFPAKILMEYDGKMPLV